MVSKQQATSIETKINAFGFFGRKRFLPQISRVGSTWRRCYHMRLVGTVGPKIQDENAKPLQQL